MLRGTVKSQKHPLYSKSRLDAGEVGPASRLILAPNAKNAENGIT